MNHHIMVHSVTLVNPFYSKQDNIVSSQLYKQDAFSWWNQCSDESQ